MTSELPAIERVRASLELLYSISRELTAELDMRELLQRVMKLTLKEVAALSGSIIVLDEDEMLKEGAVIFDGNVLDYPVENLSTPFKEGLAGWVYKEGRAAFVTNTLEDKRWIQQTDDSFEDAVRSAISVPLVARNRVVGVLTMVHPGEGHFSDEDLSLLQTIADQAATAVANAQLFGESQRRVQALGALVYTARAVAGSMNLEEVLDLILAKTTSSLQAEAASVALIDPETDELVFKFASGKVAGDMVGIRLQKGAGIAGWVVEHNEPLIVTNVGEDPRFYEKVDEQVGFETRVIAAAPIPGSTGTLGVLEAINPSWGDADQEQIELLTGIAFLAGSAISRSQLFAEIQSARQRYTGLYEESIDPILITDLGGAIIDTNLRAQTFLGLTPDEMLGQSVYDLKLPDVERIPEEISHLEPGQTISYENHPDLEVADVLPIEVHVKRMDISDQPILQWILRDISERLELDKLRSDLTSMIFHDLRAPLSNIISSLEVLHTYVTEGDDAFRSVLSIAQRSSRRASRLVESLLDLDRLEAGKAVLNKSQAAIGDLIAEAVEEVHPMAEARGHVIHFDIMTDLPKVEMDTDMIFRVLINIVENAIKYTRSGGQITIAAHKKDGEIVVSVQDSGLGISAFEQQRIFEKYIRIKTDERPKGLGLGLAFCRLAVEEHKGRIWVESEKGKGSTFFFTLPV
jgi:PAS domain S-box-containing protein